MTQAFNLSQIANRVNTSGQLNAATGLFNQVPVANGGTGKSTVTTGALLIGAGTSAMTELTGTTPATTIISSPTGWTSAPLASAGGGDYVMNSYLSPNTWTKPGTLKAIKVTVVGAGGTGGTVAAFSNPVPTTGVTGGGGGGGATILYLDAPAIPGPVSVTAGAGTNSFGAFCSATAGANAGTAPGPASNVQQGATGGSGSGGSFNMVGGAGVPGIAGSFQGIFGGLGGSSIFGGGGFGGIRPFSAGSAGGNYGGGGGGAVRVGNNPAANGGTGAPGIVIVEEFY